MLETISFVDLVALSRITTESTVEKFGGLINSSFFDASNILGTLKQKGLVDFVTAFPNQSAITVTEQGKEILTEAAAKAAQPFDTLDMAILVQLSNRMRSLQEITSGVNVTQKDLAMHLYRLSQQQYLSYELRNGNMNINLTEKGFLAVKDGPQAPTTQAATNVSLTEGQQLQQPSMVDAAQQMDGTTPQQPQTKEDLIALEAKIINAKKTRTFLIIGIVVVVVILLGYLAFFMHLI
ncbi:MAG: hypothetical protein ABR981_00015 [Candidatus Micrarchaeaceae archaeon]|jgi:DNA-binding MarR family transcriptional regulator